MDFICRSEEDRELVEQAAAVEGLSVSAWVAMVAKRAAQEVLRIGTAAASSA